MAAESDQLIAELRPLVADERVLAAIGAVPRERFVLPRDRERAYENVALPIADGQTISQPLVVARMLELLRLEPGDRVLDVGTGSGYHAALLSRLAQRVWSIERIAELSAAAAATLRELGITNVGLAVGDGTQGLPEHAPYDAINVAAAATSGVPRALLAQLAEGGRLVAPIGGERQYLVHVVRTGQRFVERRLDPVRFVPLIGERERFGGGGPPHRPGN
ncbi:MAG TPA: protein-L-isoaspartate(D-aspartate) O-methyltransferase [Solirubrobacteraceae bacterium]|nr:protein-L-isoaspartate(D-aspartate) O-methyltransferase [Solirubrobacteraceae bacterium]